jgi:hypothetical protein
MFPARLSFQTKYLYFGLLLLVLSLFTARAQAEQVEHFGDYDVHYSVFNTSFLAADIAKSYGITRSKNQALVNISVLKKNRDGSSKAVSAIVKGKVGDLIHSYDLDFFTVREEKAIYYLSPMRISDKQEVYFTIDIQPDPNSSPLTLKFKKTLYID